MNRYFKLSLAIFTGIVTAYISMLFFVYISELLGIANVKHIDDLSIILGFVIGYYVSWLVGRRKKDN